MQLVTNPLNPQRSTNRSLPILKGTVNVDERAPGGHELIVTSAEVVGAVRG